MSDYTRKPTRSKEAQEAKEKAAEEETVRLNVEVPKSYRDFLRLHALEEDTTVKAIVNGLIAEYRDEAMKE